MRLFRSITPTHLLLLSALRFGPKTLRLCFVGERRTGLYRVPADIVVDAERSAALHELSGVLSLDDRTFTLYGTLSASARLVEMRLQVAELGPCILKTSALPFTRYQPGLSLRGDFERAPNCHLELRVDLKALARGY